MVENVEMVAKPLKTMFEMQESLQNAIGAKRGTICPNTWQKKDVDDIYRVMAKESGYYMMSTITELFEMFEQIKKDNYQYTELVKFELIDAWHFVMNQILYLNVKPTEELSFYMGKARENIAQVDFVNHDLHYIVGQVVEAMGEIYQNTSYKLWKTYDKPKEDPAKLQELCDTFLIRFCTLFVVLGMNEQDVWNYYYAKNKENFHRQQDPNGRYYK